MPCPFCNLSTEQYLCSNRHAFAIYDRFPLSKGHTIIISRRHAASFFELTIEEQQGVLELLNIARDRLQTDFSPDGFNIGINDGEAAGQTILHLHLHLIPRYQGDQADPRGGIRLIFPDKAPYWCVHVSEEEKQ